MGMGTKVLGVMGGTLEMFGRRERGWTRLGATAEAGDTTITLDGPVPWDAGDEIVIASTGYWRAHDEERTITKVSGTILELDRPLSRQHWGTIQTFDGRAVDERAEVGLLTRNVKVQGDESSTKEGFGGHTMIMEGGEARIDGVEFANMGQKKALRRYPVHFHMDGDGSSSYLKRSSIHHSFNRCVTIHGTNRLRIKNNVCFDHIGHGFFMEDGAETGTIIAGNLGLGTLELEGGLLPTDESPATFWITNPDNVVKNNVAAGSDGFGFWYALPEHPTGLSQAASQKIWPRRTPLRVFSGNVAHSNSRDGLNVDHGPDENGETTATWYKPVVDPTDEDSDPVVARFQNFTAYMNRNRAVWLRGENHVVEGGIFADNRAGATFASSESFLDDSLVVGATANPGTTESWEETGPGGKSLPFFWEPEAPIIGFEFYDGRVAVRDTTFVGFQSNNVRKSGALGYLTPDAFSIDPENFATGLRFVDSNSVYMPDPEPGMDGDLSKVFVDQDGSVTGSPGKTVVANNPFLLNPGCSFNTDWNSHVCESDYATLIVGAPNSSPAAIKPVILRRGDGTEQRLNGCCDDSRDAVTTVVPDRIYDVEFTGGTPAKTRFVLWNGRGNWTILKMKVAPTFKVTRWGYAIPSVASASALSDKSGSSYFYDAATGILHLKIDASTSDWEELRVES